MQEVKLLHAISLKVRSQRSTLPRLRVSVLPLHAARSAKVCTVPIISTVSHRWLDLVDSKFSGNCHSLWKPAFAGCVDVLVLPSPQWNVDAQVVGAHFAS